MTIDSDIIKRITGLANLQSTAEEQQQLQGDLNKILDYVGQLSAIDTTGIAPVMTPFAEEAIWREDKVVQDNSSDDILDSAPQSKMGFFVVPKVVDQDG